MNGREFQQEAREILDVLNQLEEAFETLLEAEALGCDPGWPMSVEEAQAMIYGDDTT